MTVYTSPFGNSSSLPISSVWDYVWSNPNNIPDDKVCLIDPINDERWTRYQLKTFSQSLAYGLIKDKVVKPGDTVCIFSPNSIHYYCLLFACQCAGLIVSTANAAYTPNELLHQLQNSETSFVFAHPDILPVAKQALDLLGWDKQRQATNVCLALRRNDINQATQFQTYDFFQRHTNPDGSKRLLSPHKITDPKNTVAYLGYSSGTSGPAKGVMTSHYNMTSLLASLYPLDLTKDSIQACILPLSHIYALSKILHWPILTGQTVVVFPKYQLDRFCEAVQKYKIEVCMLVPPIALALARDTAVDNYDLSSLQLVASGAAPLGGEIEEELSKRLKVDVVQIYGLTEMSPTATYCPKNRKNPGSIGFVLPNMEFRVVDPVTLKDVEKEGMEGELWMRGPNRMLGYYKRPDANAESITHDGWLRTGDVIYVKDEYIFMTDRIKELIKYKGFQVPPAELEALLLTHPKIKDVCVTGVYDESQATELPKAYVVLNNPKDGKDPKALEREVQDWVKEKVTNAKRLRGGVQIIDSVPKSPSGKILRRILRDKYQKKRESKL